MGVNAPAIDKRTWILFAIIAVSVIGKKINDSKGVFSVKGQTNEYILEILQDEDLVYTKHAKCRMDCRDIDKSEVMYILENGHVNWKKSDKDDEPCPSYALEGITKDGQEVRIIFANCNNATKVVTAIDLGNEYDCVCD